MTCKKCGRCCEDENTTINVNVLDLAKVIEDLGDYDYKKFHAKNRGFGEIKKDGKTIVIIAEEPIKKIKRKDDKIIAVWSFIPQAYLAKPCPYHDKGLCNLHGEKISDELSVKLKRYNYNNGKKIKICGDHPIFLDYEDGLVKQYEPCCQLEKTIIVTDQTVINKIKTESKLIIELQGMLYDYWKITNNYPILSLAEKILNNKKDPIKPFIRKLNELKRTKGISEENINNSYTTINNLLTNTNRAAIKEY